MGSIGAEATEQLSTQKKKKKKKKKEKAASSRTTTLPPLSEVGQKEQGP